jgi:serine/threonine protein phosphatase PrpC
MSGSTSVGVYLNENKLYCCNLGDSKAVLGSFEINNKWKATALSIDHTL